MYCFGVRKTPALKLRSSPLVFVLSQIRFAPILKMSEFIPEIQERLRRTGFPGFEVRRPQEIEIGPTQIAIPKSRWFFWNRTRTSVVIVSDDFVVLGTSRYTLFEAFAEALNKVLVVISETTAPSHTERLGLRYVDLVRPAEGESFDDYLNTGLRGLSLEALGARTAIIRSHTLAETDEGSLSIRIWQNRDGQPLPPDLARDDFPVVAPQAKDGETWTILDIDHYSSESHDFVVDKLIGVMWALHDGAARAFRASVTANALARWGSESADGISGEGAGSE